MNFEYSVTTVKMVNALGKYPNHRLLDHLSALRCGIDPVCYVSMS
ncbi:hypothetical protein ACFBZI_05160 [Moraxella sp. ZJ142]